MPIQEADYDGYGTHSISAILIELKAVVYPSVCCKALWSAVIEMHHICQCRCLLNLDNVPGSMVSVMLT